jgi:lipoyl(octanoyl) transferase
MQNDRSLAPRAEPAVEAYLLGVIDYDACLALQQRLVYECSGRSDGQISLLLCEHPPTITIGREGSRAHVCLDRRELECRGVPLRWVNRGGGCLPHAPGQLAVYPIVPLEWHRMTVGGYLDRLQMGLAAALGDLRVFGQTSQARHGIWGRAGQLVSIGAAVKNWVTYHGAFINVAPPLRLFRRVTTDSRYRTEMSSLVVERQQPVRMSGMRESVVRRVSEALGCGRYHLYTGHPLLVHSQEVLHESAHAG